MSLSLSDTIANGSDRLVPVREACRILGGISERWLWARTAPRGPIICRRLGRRVMYAVSDLLDYAASVRKAAAHVVEGGVA